MMIETTKPRSVMPRMTLRHKAYQEQALAALSGYLAECRRVGSAAIAFRQTTTRSYTAEPFGEAVPCVCLRIPTGGGKTVIAARAIPVIAEYFGGADAPVVLWLVPSDAILSQTLAALGTPGHPYHQKLAEIYGDRLLVCALDAVANIAAPDWGQRAIIIVSTLQSFNVEKTNIRRVYSFSESFENHFKSKTEFDLRSLHAIDSAILTQADVADDPERLELLKNYIGQPKMSLANWLALQSPIVIVDEAHNAKTDKSFVTLTRLNPSAVLELTATPIAGKTNVLYHVSAQQLQAESMIKMPIMLAEHTEGWEKAVLAAVHTRGALADAAVKEQAAGRGYIRPIVLFQAMNEGAEVPPEKLREHLQTELKIPPEQIAVATGKTRGLEDIDLAATDCPICYVITVQALREGWDCPFAYVLCSLQNLSSATAIEQLLGRVLRMPYAEARGEPALNRAYAHVTETQTRRAATILVDRLVSNMGFDPLDAAALLAPATDPAQATFSGTDWQDESERRALAVVTDVEVVIRPDVVLPDCATVATPVGATAPVLSLRGWVPPEASEQLLAATKGKADKVELQRRIEQHNAFVSAGMSPAMLGVVFPPLPRLAFREDIDSTQGELQLLDREAVMEAVELDLLTHQALDVGRFDGVAQTSTFEIDTGGDGRVFSQRADAAQIPMNYGSTQLTAADIARWLDQSLFQKTDYLTQQQRLAYFTAVVQRLVNEKHHSIGQLAEVRFQLARTLLAKLEDLRAEACSGAFKQAVLDEAWAIDVDWIAPHTFSPTSYAVAPASRYAGRHRFKRHYYTSVADLRDAGEEFECAELIDQHTNVDTWIRNLDGDSGFNLPTSRGRFFPDFVVHLKDGRMAVVEYKGEHLRGFVPEIEKRAVGRLWATKSGGRCVFDFVFKKGDHGESLQAQIDALFAPAHTVSQPC
jgi:type III restriction enzyme